MPKKIEKCLYYSQPPMRSTQILYPLDDDTPETVIRKINESWKLNDLKEGKVSIICKTT
jgi:hypothetical protein